MSPDGKQLDAAELHDLLLPRPVLDSRTIHSGAVFDLVSDRIDLGRAGVVEREYVSHPGAVGVLALDDHDRVLMVRQYRHAVRHELWEIPAGLLDVAGEPPAEAAARELAEEADLRASRWDVLIDWFNSPGGNDEAVRVYLARDLEAVPHDERHEREHEELDMPTAWVALDDALEAVLAGQVHNPTAVVGVLAACAARARGWKDLRPADAPWREHKHYR
ncbi:MAG TPA: NUDIX hydrolase [Nocardioidaceae bacterium]|nr:NUDIX hydrolase [Nocardioidaceae bacterium]